jgi:hypothetical protein
MSVSDAQLSEEESFECNMEGVSEGSNENPTIYFDEERQNYSSRRFEEIKGQPSLSCEELQVL